MPRPDIIISTGSATSSTNGEPDHPLLQAHGRTRRFSVGKREILHVRHQHKYAETALPPSRWFYFHTDESSGSERPTAASLREFRERMAHVAPDTVSYHASRGDFSRWVAGAHGDHELAAQLSRVENEFVIRTTAAVEYARDDIRAAIQRRYLHGSD
jgi:hypothetical protein